MSQLEGIDLEEKSNFGGESPNSGSHSSRDHLCHQNAQGDFPDGGLRAWLVVLGVRSS